jgi:hypothetical protein
MLGSAESKNLTYLFNQFLKCEEKGWTELDDFLDILDYLDDDQLCKESAVLFSFHKNKNMGCPYKHATGTQCFVKPILEGVEAILNLHDETGNLHINNRYILLHYLALSETGNIIEI